MSNLTIMEKIKTATLAIAIAASSLASPAMADDFDYVVDRFADIQVLRYKVPDFESLSLRQKMLVYHLTEAALAGRDILWDQNNRYNLSLRHLLENIYSNYDGDRNSDDYKAFETYLKQVWFANGNHHHYSMDKFVPAFSRDFMEKQIAALPDDKRPADKDQLLRYIFDPAFMPKKVNQVAGEDLILTSAVNLYDGVTHAEVEQYYASRKDSTDLTPVMHGLNTRVVKDSDGKIVEQTYKSIPKLYRGSSISSKKPVNMPKTPFRHRS